MWAAFLFARPFGQVDSKPTMLPILLLLAGAAFTAPVAITAANDYQLSQNPETLAAYVREYYKDTPVLAAIAECESQMRQFDKDGAVLKNPKSTAIGLMQIMASLHDEAADELGIDINTTKGNLDYAKYLYEKQGTKPWNSSKACWGKGVSANTYVSPGETKLAIAK